MEILRRGQHYRVWGDPRVSRWAPPEIAYEPATHGSRLGAVMHELASRSGLVLRTCREDQRTCSLVLVDPADDSEVRLQVRVADVEEAEDDPSGMLAWALRANASLWPWPKPEGAGPSNVADYHRLAEGMTAYLRSCGVRLLTKPRPRR